MKLATATALSLLALGADAESRSLRNVPVIKLGKAGDYAILSETGITDVFPSVVVGNVGTSPITGAALLLACSEVVGNVYTVDAAGPACKITSASYLTSSIGDMVYAYNTAAGVLHPDHLDLGAGNIGGKTLSPGVYKWTSDVLIAADVYLAGTDSTYDKWIFQIDGTLDLSPTVMVHLSGGATPSNIIWQVAGAATFDTTSHMEGVVLGKAAINMRTGASINGRLLAQTEVTLQVNTVVQPQN